MIISCQHLVGCRIAGQDGAKGRLKDLYFDDQDWSIKYLVVSLGGLSKSLEVVVTPEVVAGFDPSAQVIKISLNAEQLAGSPPARTIKPVCVQYQTHPGSRGTSSQFRPGSNNPHLRSAKIVLGYSLQGQGATVGLLAGLLINLESLTIRSLLVEKQVLGRNVSFTLPPSVVERISFAAGQVRLKDSNPMVVETAPITEWHDDIAESATLPLPMVS